MRGSLIAAATMTVLAGCSTYDSVTQSIAQRITPYRITVVQGNFVSQEAASQLKVGMSRDQVKALLGTPLLADMFHADRWDYIFYFKRGSTSVVQQRDFVVLFAGDRVASWSGGENLPSNLELLAEIDGDKGRKLPVAPAAASGASSAAAAAASSSGTAVAAAASAPGVQPDASSAANAFAGDANQQAAQAANRATTAVQAPTGRVRSSAMPNVPGSPGLPNANNTTGNAQIQLQRRPDTVTVPDSSAVGPQGTSPSPANTTGQGTSVPSTSTN
ncbi:membrane protein SmpA [Caballeronia mineralivorans PML1(12)]|uniref:Outer membrane protein assembly factor BamE n=1 Tax=Caballeronia mineralivorans PML1(12) TaxID=908627 RepID=A0A0J1CPS9_9BURK|nr:outer membrane protein assembly factor BamE [Caballeronia mineralivorans]KLU22640.1 membrane protein SmpA [Caballeronia mineralivorans PML1(12)]